LLSFAATAQVTGKMFPDMEAETVEDKKVKLPQETKGKFTLLGYSLFKKNPKRSSTRGFSRCLISSFKKTGGVLAGFSYDVNVYFVPNVHPER
jgi:hypothetical protein